MLLLICGDLKLVIVSTILILLKVRLGEVIFDGIECRSIVVGNRRRCLSIVVASPSIILLLGPTTIIGVNGESKLRRSCRVVVIAGLHLKSRPLPGRVHRILRGSLCGRSIQIEVHDWPWRRSSIIVILKLSIAIIRSTKPRE